MAFGDSIPTPACTKSGTGESVGMKVTAIALCQVLIAQSQPGDAADGIAAAVKSSDGPVAFHGYYFRRLAGPGNRFLRYRLSRCNTGHRASMTFIVDPDGGAYQKDLGSNTDKIAGTMDLPYRSYVDAR